jgi:amidophosphoribosyltransferase
LIIGKRPSADSSGIEWAIASEDCAFGPIAFERVRDVQPGEMVIITPEGQLISKQVSRAGGGSREPVTAVYVCVAAVVCTV